MTTAETVAEAAAELGRALETADHCADPFHRGPHLMDRVGVPLGKLSRHERETVEHLAADCAALVWADIDADPGASGDDAGRASGMVAAAVRAALTSFYLT